MLPYYGVQGTVLIFSGLALNIIALALFYQPVQWHIRRLSIPDNIDQNNSTAAACEISEIKCSYCKLLSRKSTKLFSSQNLYNSDHQSIAGYEIIDPGTPMMSRANDGWYSAKNSNYSSRLSLSSGKFNTRIESNTATNDTISKPHLSRNNSANLNSYFSQGMNSNRSSYTNLGSFPKDDKRSHYGQGTVIITSNRSSYTSLSNLTKEEKREKRKEMSNRIKIDEALKEELETFINDCDYLNENNVDSANKIIPDGGVIEIILNDRPIIIDNAYQTNKCNSNSDQTRNKSLTVDRNNSTNSIYVQSEDGANKDPKCHCAEERELYRKMIDNNLCREPIEKLTFLQKILIFFDLDLLKDLTYVNLMIGVTIAGFAELNYSILTPFVLAEYEFTKQQIAMVMSLLGTMDISVRFFVPFIAGKIGWENNTYFLVGIFGMALGRICKLEL